MHGINGLRTGLLKKELNFFMGIFFWGRELFEKSSLPQTPPPQKLFVAMTFINNPKSRRMF